MPEHCSLYSIVFFSFVCTNNSMLLLLKFVYLRGINAGMHALALTPLALALIHATVDSFVFGSVHPRPPLHPPPPALPLLSCPGSAPAPQLPAQLPQHSQRSAAAATPLHTISSSPLLHPAPPHSLTSQERPAAGPARAQGMSTPPDSSTWAWVRLWAA